MLVTVVHEHGGEEFIEVGFIRFEFLYLEDPVVKFGWMLQKLLISSGRVHYSGNNEDGEAGSDQNRRNRDKLEVRTDSILDHI